MLSLSIYSCFDVSYVLRLSIIDIFLEDLSGWSLYMLTEGSLSAQGESSPGFSVAVLGPGDESSDSLSSD